MTSSAFEFDRILSQQKIKTNMACNNKEIVETVRSYPVLYDKEIMVFIAKV